jgi:hypothetical protein
LSTFANLRLTHILNMRNMQITAVQQPERNPDMSLEQAITDHAAALRELAAAIRATVGAHDTKAAAAAHQVINDAKAQATKETATSTPTAETKKADAKKHEADRGAAAGNKSEAGPASSDATAPTYDDVKTKVLELSKEKGRDQVVALLQRHGVAKAPDLKAEQYAAVIADVTAILAGTLDVTAGEPA